MAGAGNFGRASSAGARKSSGMPAPRGFDAIVRDDFAAIREMIARG
jgi:hypothetical protein